MVWARKSYELISERTVTWVIHIMTLFLIWWNSDKLSYSISFHLYQAFRSFICCGNFSLNFLAFTRNFNFNFHVIERIIQFLKPLITLILQVDVERGLVKVLLLYCFHPSAGYPFVHSRWLTNVKAIVITQQHIVTWENNRLT